jgi:RNA polymerase sigma-70 factor, ECF subfamily
MLWISWSVSIQPPKDFNKEPGMATTWLPSPLFGQRLSDTVRRAANLGKRGRDGMESSPGSVNLGACSTAWGKKGLQFIAFDASYLEKLRAGDTRTEEHFVSYFSELIRLKLRSRLNSKEAIEDVRQETFVRVLVLVRSEGALRQPDRLGSLVNSVCNNVLLEHYRSKSRNESAIDEETENTFVNRDPSALRLLEAKDTKRVVRQTLSELTERDRRLLQSVLLDERDKDEVCAELGISREYLRVLVHRAKQSFKSFYLRRLGSTRPC